LVIKIGVLELQGNFALHHKVLSKLEIESLSVKHKKDLNRVNGLIIPGGESTTISLLIDSFKLRSHLIEFSKSNPIMGTCAGLILMAKNVPDKRVNPLGLLNINIERNAYGRQIMSRTECLNFKFNKKINFDLETTFIRAPKITKIKKGIKILAKYKNSPIAILSDHFLGLTFHPELNDISIFHQILFDPKSEVYYQKLNQKYAA
jgi:5'-phosphate synthase pdxT subunit|tara:strand:- start:962 stop:1576 length:615 start_codon:yes stop_codon:yes gene_type:complete